MRMFALVLFSLPVVAISQITPIQTYNGIGRPLWVQVKAKGNAKIQLLKPVTAEVFVEKEASAGKVDLAKLFPVLWEKKPNGVLYAQLVVNGRKVGPAVVLQPMMNPPLAKLGEDKKTVEWEVDEDGPLYNGIRAYVDHNLVIETTMGTMVFRLRPDAAPNTAWTIMELARGGLYTNSIFHRVVAKRADGTPFVIQGGDPTGTGSGGAGFSYPLEKSPLPHDFGVISIARSTDPNTNGCQFFVCLSRDGTKHLDGKYASFGECVRGGDVVLKIAAVPVGEGDRPKDPPVIRRVYLVSAAPYGTGPSPLSRPK